jgi:hypothetical protein
LVVPTIFLICFLLYPTRALKDLDRFARGAFSAVGRWFFTRFHNMSIAVRVGLIALLG